jgi:hypothetical protein
VGLPISAPDVIEPAFRHTREQLFEPFRFGQWMRLAFVGLLAGEAVSFNGCNFSYPANTEHRGSQQFVAGTLPAQFTDHPALFAALIVALVLVGIALLVLFTYISSVMRFILFDSIVARECHVRRGWARRKEPGFRFFVWQLFLMLSTLVILLIVVGVPVAYALDVGWFTHAGDHVLALVLGGIALFLILLVLLIFVGVVNVMTKDFVVPQMALENIGVIEGWRRLWIKQEKGGYAAYVGMKIVLSIGATIAVLIVTIFVLIVLFLIIGGVGVAAVLGGMAAGLTWNAYTISLAVVLGCIAIAILLFVAALISVPVIVFFPAYSIYFFAPRYSPLASLLWPEAPAPAASDYPPPGPTAL